MCIKVRVVHYIEQLDSADFRVVSWSDYSLSDLTILRGRRLWQVVDHITAQIPPDSPWIHCHGGSGRKNGSPGLKLVGRLPTRSHLPLGNVSIIGLGRKAFLLIDWQNDVVLKVVAIVYLAWCRHFESGVSESCLVIWLWDPQRTDLSHKLVSVPSGLFPFQMQ